MNSTVPRGVFLSADSAIKILLAAIFASTCTLSIKAAYDLAENSEIFPRWFVPGFMAGIIILIAVSLYFVVQTWKVERYTHPLTGNQSIYLWVLMLFSFICTTAVHGFYPFHPGILTLLPTVDSVLKINFGIAVGGFAVSTVLASIYIFSRLKLPAIIGLMMLALIALIPNDNCANPFNYWWIRSIGASPLMYVPNMYAALFVASGLHGIHPNGAVVLTTCICVGSLLLGIGHQMGIIW